VRGPESLLVESGNTIYTGTWDAKLLKIVDGVMQKTLRLTNQTHCGSFDTEPICGRPLGLRRLNSEQIVVVDAYLGIFLVNFEKGSWKKIFSPTDVQPSTAFINDGDVLDEHTIIFTDSSSRWDRRRFPHAFLEQKPEGRVFKLSKSKGANGWESELLLSGLYFANGIQILPDRQSLVVSECSMARIVRYFFAGPKKGLREIFAENLPGFPDNIRLSTINTLLIGVASVRHSEDPGLLDKLGPLVWLRKLVGELIPQRYLGELLTLVKKNHGMVIELDLKGNIIASYQDPSGVVVADVSQASDDDKFLYLGSFHSDFIGKVSKKRGIQ